MSSSEVYTWLQNEITKLEAAFGPEVKAVEADVEAIGAATLSFIKSQGLQDLYQIALAALTGAATGTPWATVAATVVSQGEAAGMTIAKGAETIVLAQAQADLISAGKLIAPNTGAVVIPNAPVAAAPAA